MPAQPGKIAIDGFGLFVPKTSCVECTLSHNVGVSYRRKILFSLVLIIAGCATVPRTPPPDIDLRPKETLTATPMPPSHIPTNPPRTVPPPTHPIPPADHYSSTETWIPLEQWCKANGLSAPKRTLTEAAVLYSFVLNNGNFTIRIGSRNATWRGTQLWLGYAPQTINGHPYVHALDIRKNFMPLIADMVPTHAPHIVVIDPGHGGNDVGTKNVFSGRYEKDYTLDWAMRLQSILNARGCTAYLTRKKDSSVDHFERADIAEQHHAEVFVSLHFNSAFPDNKPCGLETYCLTPKGLPSNETRGYKDDLKDSFRGNAFDAENLRLAFRIHRALLKVNGHLDRGIKRERFTTVLQEEDCPAVLVEGGYMSNHEEARRIADPAYRQKLAEAVADALLEETGNPMGLSSASATATNHLSPSSEKSEWHGEARPEDRR